jgi:hypothetical protein
MPSNMLVILSVFALLGATGLIGLGLVIAVFGRLNDNRLVTRRGLQLAGSVAGLYLVVLGGVGLASHERVLPVGAEKYFCELDCHLAYSVEQVVPVRTGDGAVTSWAVKVRTRFDERTISPTRGDGPLWPNPRQLALIGSDGKGYSAEAKLDRSLSESSTPLTRELKPGESYSTWVGFILPQGIKPSRLEIAEDLFLNRFMIGNERSFLHSPTYFGLGIT